MSLVVQRLGRCAYADALSLQHELVARKQAGDRDDYLLLVEHEPVYTLGRGVDAADLQGADERLHLPVFRVGRGGGVTFHGPGQVVAYPIVALRPGARDVHKYVHDLESVLIGVCAHFGIAAQRRSGHPGAWVKGAKIASVGIGIRRWITFHGMALNVSTDLAFFAPIVACRMPDVRMTSVALERGSAPPLAAVESAVVQHFEEVFSCAPLPISTGASA